MMPCMQYSRLLAVLALSAASWVVASAQESKQPAVSGTDQARCIVRIAADRDMLPINAMFIEELLVSTPVLDEPAQEILGCGPDEIGDSVIVSFTPLDESHGKSRSTLIGKISVEVGGDLARPAARELLAAIAGRLEESLRQVGEMHAHRLRERLGVVQEEMQRLEGESEGVRVTQRALLEQAGRDDLDRELLGAIVRETQRDLDAAELRQAGARAREAALTEQIAVAGQRAIEAAEKSEVVAEFARVVEFREQEVEHLRKLSEAGQASVAVLRELETGLAAARAELAGHREQAAARAGAGMLAKLNEELVGLMIESAEKEAHLEALRGRLAEMPCPQAARTRRPLSARGRDSAGAFCAHVAGVGRGRVSLEAPDPRPATAGGQRHRFVSRLGRGGP